MQKAGPDSRDLDPFEVRFKSIALELVETVLGMTTRACREPVQPRPTAEELEDRQTPPWREDKRDEKWQKGGCHVPSNPNRVTC